MNSVGMITIVPDVIVGRRHCLKGPNVCTLSISVRCNFDCCNLCGLYKDYEEI